MSGTPAKVQHKVSFHDDLDDLEESQSKPKLQQKVSFHAGLEEDSNDREDLSSPASSPSATSPCHEEEDNVSDESAEEAPIKKKRSLRSTNTAGSIASGPGPPRLYKPPTWMRRLLTSKLFLSTNALIILLNMVWTGFLANSYVDIEVNEHADGTAFFVIENLFTGVFLAELIIRMIYFASIRFWHDLWLCFDLVVIGCPAVEIWILRPLGWNEGTFTITVMNIFRVFRVGRGVAALANIKWFRPMYLAAVGFKHSMNSLMVVFIYLASLTFTVAVVLCHLLGPSNPKFSDLPELVRGRFRSVERSVLSVIECLLGGIEWGPDLVDLLLFNQDTVFAGMVLLTFLVLGSLLWLNTVSGIFMQQVDRSFELTNMTQFGDKEYQAATRELLREFMEDLYEMDHDGTQSLSWREISLVVTHHMEVLSDLGIRMPEAKRIFGELNMNSAGYVSIPMFLNRVQDNMRYKTVETLIFENQQYRLLHLMGKLAKLDKKSSKKVTDQLRLMSASMEEVQSHEPMQQAVQRRLARQRQRVSGESLQMEMSGTMMNDELSKTSVSAPHLPSHQAVTALSGRGLMLECWKRSVQRQRLDIRSMVNPSFARL